MQTDRQALGTPGDEQRTAEATDVPEGDEHASVVEPDEGSVARRHDDTAGAPAVDGGGADDVVDVLPHGARAAGDDEGADGRAAAVHADDGGLGVEHPDVTRVRGGERADPPTAGGESGGDARRRSGHRARRCARCRGGRRGCRGRRPRRRHVRRRRARGRTTRVRRARGRRGRPGLRRPRCGDRRGTVRPPAEGERQPAARRCRGPHGCDDGRGPHGRGGCRHGSGRPGGSDRRGGVGRRRRRSHGCAVVIADGRCRGRSAAR